MFGAKFVELVPPAQPSSKSLHAGQVLDSQHVTVEINTVFQQLTSVLGKLDPAKLNETLGAIATALSGRGAKIGQTFSDLDSFLAKLDPSLPALSHDIAVSPQVFNAYADAAPDLVKTVDNSTKISQTIVDEQHNLDALLVSAIGLADIGNDVLGANRKPLTNVLHLLVPTTDLTERVQQSAVVRFRRARKHSALSAVAGTEHRDIGESHVGRRTLSVSDEPAQGRGDGRSAVPGPSEPSLQHQCEACRHRYRRQPGAVREPAAADQLRSPQTAVVRADRRPTAQLCSDRGTRMRSSMRATLVKFGVFAVVMAVLTAFLFFIFGQYRTGATIGYSAVFADASRLKSGDSVRVAGIRVGTVNGVALQANKKVVVKFDADRSVVFTTAPGRRFATSTWSVTATSNSSTVRGRPSGCRTGARFRWTAPRRRLTSICCSAD